MTEKKLAHFMWQSPSGKITNSHATENQVQEVYDELKRLDVVFVCFPGDMPIPRNRK